MKNVLFVFALAPLAFIGCATSNTQTETAEAATTIVEPASVSTSQPASTPASQEVASTTTFKCANGLEPTISVINTDQINLQVDGKSAVMTRAVSGSGVRYVSTTDLYGKGAEWHQKANEAVFAYKDATGKAMETNCAAK